MHRFQIFISFDVSQTVIQVVNLCLHGDFTTIIIRIRRIVYSPEVIFAFKLTLQIQHKHHNKASKILYLTFLGQISQFYNYGKSMCSHDAVKITLHLENFKRVNKNLIEHRFMKCKCKEIGMSSKILLIYFSSVLCCYEFFVSFNGHRLGKLKTIYFDDKSMTKKTLTAIPSSWFTVFEV